MRTYLFSIIMTSFSIFFASSAFADPADCYKATPSSLSVALSVELCTGAQNTAPVACYRSTPTSLSQTLSVKLCKGSKSSAPATCYRATPTSLNADLSVTLCTNSNDSSPVGCYRRTPTSLSAVNSVALCKIDPIRPYVGTTTSRIAAPSNFADESSLGTKNDLPVDTKESHLSASDLKNATYSPKVK